MDEWLECFLQRILDSIIPIMIGLVGVILLIIAVLGVGCLFSGPAAGPCLTALGAAIVAGLPWLVGFLVAALVLMLIAFAIQCAFVTGIGPAAGVAGATPVGGALDSGRPVDCDSARALLAEARQALAAAEAARDAARDRVTTTRNRMNQAAAALAGAVAALAAAIVQPWLLPGAIAAVVAATALLAARARQHGAAVLDLATRERDLLLALANVAAAEALVLALCSADQAGDAGEVIIGGSVPQPTVLGRAF